MNEQQKKKSRSGKKRKRNKSQRKDFKGQEQKRNPVICSICKKQIDMVATAVSGLEEGEIAHLECVAKHYEQSEELNERQRILYIGQGTFAVVEYKNAHKHGPFTIVKRISHEDAERNRQLMNSLQDRLPDMQILKQ